MCASELRPTTQPMHSLRQARGVAARHYTAVGALGLAGMLGLLSTSVSGRQIAEKAAKKPAADRAEKKLNLPPIEPDPPPPLPRPKPRPGLLPELVPLDQLAPRLTNSIGMKLACIPAGSFLMGSHESLDTLNREFRRPHISYDDEFPQHLVFLSKHFYMGVYEVTQEEYEQVMGVNPSSYGPKGHLHDKVKGKNVKRFPVESVSWDDANAFCRALSALPGEREHGRAYRLPTEAEWEYACRGGGQQPPTRYSFGSTTSKVSKHGRIGLHGVHKVHEVGSLLPNAFGLYDMIGNVPEWCLDYYGKFYYRERVTIDPLGPSEPRPIPGESRSGWRVTRYGPRSSQRSFCEPDRTVSSNGFRVVFIATRPQKAGK